METTRVVVTERDGVLVVYFYGVPVYTDGGSGSFRFDQSDLVLIVESPLGAKLAAIRDHDAFNASISRVRLN
jgi:hypothetical protein